jgi:hypothetical protein
MTIDDSSPHALTSSENYQQIQTAKLINLKMEIAKGIKDVKSGRCWRRLNFDHLCRLNLDQGLVLV